MSPGHAAVRLTWQDFRQLAPDADAALLQLARIAAAHGLDKDLLELVKLRASQPNGCAFCVTHHVAAAQRLGVRHDRLHLVVAWRDAPQFDARERAALAWTEALTLLARGVPDETYAEARAVFSEQELADLTTAVLAINAWNRLGVAYRFPPPAIAAEPKAAAA
jgi:AhpD family alkylhydroperoxidase